jgi:hypothetical protein
MHLHRNGTENRFQVQFLKTLKIFFLKIPLNPKKCGPPLKMELGPKIRAKVNQHSPAHHPLDGCHE